MGEGRRAFAHLLMRMGHGRVTRDGRWDEDEDWTLIKLIQDTVRHVLGWRSYEQQWSARHG